MTQPGPTGPIETVGLSSWTTHRMSQAGVSDDAIISYIEKSARAVRRDADDIIAHDRLDVSKDVIKAVVDESAAARSAPLPRRAEST